LIDRAGPLPGALETNVTTPSQDKNLDGLSWAASLPFFVAHAACGLALVTGVTWHWVLVALVSYYVRMFGVTAGYHRYFAHRAYRTNRVFQFLLAVLAQSSAQKGALWWAAHHRHHHRTSDTEEDIHSPARKGFWYSHVGWILSRRWDATNYGAIKDFARYPELVWLNKFHLVPLTVLLVVLYALGGLPLFLWGGLIPTVLLWHGTFTINSLSHIFGSRRYVTTDTSRNNFLLALITMGEGWHNNHHFHQNTANQGWFWWEVDATFTLLKALSWLGVVSNLRLPSAQTKLCYLQYTEAQRASLREEARFNMFRPRLPRPAASPPSTLLGLGAPAPAQGQ
jgi:stearoyl-CoA desaturase (delta-9 desaturase)